MPSLSRTSTRLLKTVKGQPHASEADHERPLASSSASSPLSDVPHDPDDDENIFRDPDSSSDEESRSIEEAKLKKNLAPTTALRKPVDNSTTLKNDSVRSTAKRKQPEVDDDEQPDWMTASQQSKRFKNSTKYQSQSQKSSADHFKRPTHTPTKKEKFKNAVFKKPGENGSSLPSSQVEEPRSSQNGFLRPSIASTNDTTQPALDSSYNVADLPSSPGAIPSSPPSSTVEEVYLDGDDPNDFESCPFCSESVSKDFRAEWELENCRGRRMDLKMQEKFCQAHKAEEARQTWREKQYPEVNWDVLPGRLKKHKAKIDKILDGKMHSSFRADFEEKVRSADSRTALKIWDPSVVKGASVGYYGIKGAELISDFALKTFDAKLKRIAAKDKLLATASAAGGLTGFVQAVIVPELAMSLIEEDLSVDTDQARRILDESTRLGDMLNAEEDESLILRGNTPPPTYGADGAADIK